MPRGAVRTRRLPSRSTGRRRTSHSSTKDAAPAVRYARVSARERGVTALEYGLMAALVVLVVGSVAFTQLDTILSSVWSNLSSQVIAAASKS